VEEPALISDHGRSAFQRTRLPNLHSTTCCFPNVVRFLGQLPEYLFSADADGIWVNLYTTSTVEHTLSDDTPVTIEVETTYPHAGSIRITLRSQREAEFTLRVRIPGWCDGADVTVCGEPVAGVQPGTYLPIRRAWGAADVVEIELPMRPIALEAHPAAAECRGQMAYRRGPLVYCLEQVDVPDVPLQSMRAVADSAIGEAPGAGELDGIPLLRIATAASGEWAEPCAYRPASPRITHGEANLVPFYARANREGPGGWLVWLPT